MTVTVVVGGQFGSEGKGKITSHLCKNHDYTVAVRCGGPNSGHTVTIDNEQVVLQQIPAGVVNPKSKLYISAGCLINLRLLLEEIKTFGLDENRIKIDKNAAIIEDEQIKNEIQDSLNEKIGSTCTGVGSTVASRALRRGNLKFARDIPELKKYLTTVSKDIMRHYHHKDNIVIEGTQGYGLSLYHSQYYPFTTSRDTTASCFLSEVGISPLVVENVIMVIRTFPIRVSGNSGPLPKEI
ncbi:MAG: adenylosuccinate synthetase, partial [Thermoplasmata archaeon]|nr:adenylosuccinate synthetase [Thermoplasmata archaeon]